jgi:hypothetical protein
MKYTIKKGKHTSRPRLIKFWLGKKEHKFQFVLDESCWHKEIDISTPGINKVCGVSFAIHAENPFGKIPIIKNLVNSVVVGWRPNYKFRNVFELYIISDSRGIEVRTKYFDNIKAGEIVNVNVTKINKKLVNVNINGVGIVKNLNVLSFGYYLGFYFGGKSTTPHNMEADVKIIK